MCVCGLGLGLCVGGWVCARVGGWVGGRMGHSWVRSAYIQVLALLAEGLACKRQEANARIRKKEKAQVQIEPFPI